MSKNNDIPAKRIRLHSYLENSTSVPPSTAAQKAISSSNVSCSADHSTTSPFDIGHFFECTEGLTESQIYDILSNILIPDTSFQFPIHKTYNKKRKFNLSFDNIVSAHAQSKIVLIGATVNINPVSAPASTHRSQRKFPEIHFLYLVEC